MDEQQRKQEDARHEYAKAHGVKFFPDIIYKDDLSFGVFVLLSC
jgi:hypothetical protein